MTSRLSSLTVLSLSLMLAHCSPNGANGDSAVPATDVPNANAETSVAVDAQAPADAESPADSEAPTDAEVAVDVPVVPGDGGRDPLVIARPFRVRVPENLNPAQPLPLVLLLHGYGASSMIQDSYFGLSNIVTSRNFILALPDGTLDARGSRFWDATDACCNFGGVRVDDVAYLRAVLADVRSRYNVDRNKIFVIGHSNGGFMTLRLACELSDQISAVISLAGADAQDTMLCRPAQPIHVLAVHGTADATILYPGGLMGGVVRYPGAETTVANWANRNGCSAMLTANGDAVDLDTGLLGAETVRLAHAGCRPGGSAELWRIVGGAHIPALSPSWANTVMDWFTAHARQ